MEKEIDLRPLIKEHLKCDTHFIAPFVIYDSKQINLIDRPFETNRVWTRIEKTSYIESIFLHCSLQPIIRFVNFNHTVIVDGYNRYLAITEFCDNKFALHKKGLKQLKFLENKKFSDLDDFGQNYFKKCNPIQVLDYFYDNKDKPILSPDEEFEIERYLHVIYNTGLKLELEEMQKAQFSSDFITNQIKNKLKSDATFLSYLETMKQYNGKKQRNKIDNILLNCRLLIASTYSNINQFSSAPNIQTRIEENYLPHLEKEDYNKIFQDFVINITQIYNNLIQTQKWEIYSSLHSKPFLDATYWLISVIRKDNLIDPFSFDFIKYLEYFGEKEEQEINFNSFQAHYRKNILHKYFVVAKYFEREYGVNMTSYFKKDFVESNIDGSIHSIKDLYQNHFSFTTGTVKISTLLDDLKNANYNLRPYYQRKEVMNKMVASKIIESILLGIKIPYILVYDKYGENNIVTEVVDGQQRILSILGFLQEGFKNEDGELEYSNKNGYELKDLRILYEYNDCKAISQDSKNVLPANELKKILDTEIYISKTSDKDSKTFSAIDHFIRLNKNIFTIKEDTYRMWSLTADRKIIEYEKNITRQFEHILPKDQRKRRANMITLKLACLFYYMEKRKITVNDYSNKKVSAWLKEFNLFKEKYMYKNIEKVVSLRESYYQALDEVKDFYQKLDQFIQISNFSIIELLLAKRKDSIPNSNYYYLYCMLAHISGDDLVHNHKQIYDLIKEFFVEIKTKKLPNKEILKQLHFFVQQISAYDSSKKFEFKDRLNFMLQEKNN